MTAGIDALTACPPYILAAAFDGLQAVADGVLDASDELQSMAVALLPLLDRIVRETDRTVLNADVEAWRAFARRQTMHAIDGGA